MSYLFCPIQFDIKKNPMSFELFEFISFVKKS